MKTKPLPTTIRQFVGKQSTLPIEGLTEGAIPDQPSPYGSHWYRAITCMLLSGRVAPKADGLPNRTDVNRLCKEANFNQYLFERVARFLIATEIIKFERHGNYVEGPALDFFWRHDGKKLPEVTRSAVLRLVQDRTGAQPWRPTMVWHSHLVEFLILFFHAFNGRALPETQVGQVMHDFCVLPKDDLVQAAQTLSLKIDAHSVHDWNYWLDPKGYKALVDALYEMEWAYVAEKGKTAWFFSSPIGQAMLGLEKAPAPPELPTLFKALPNRCIFAGAGLARTKLTPLFRYCTIKRIDQVFEFQVDRRRLTETPAQSSPGAELRQALHELEPLPATIASLLETKSKLGGTLAIRWCSALVKPENAEVLQSIREHPKLKGYLEPGAPPGFLLIKGRSDPGKFVQRCQELGFKVQTLHG